MTNITTNLYQQAYHCFIEEKIKSVKSYKEMCQLLNEKDYSTHPDLKKKQMQKWKQCFTWYLDKGKFVRIKMRSKEEHTIFLITEMYQKDPVFYNLCCLLYSFCMSKENNLGYLLTTTSELGMALGYYNQSYKITQRGQKDNLLEIENNTLSLKGTRYTYLSSYKKDIKNKSNKKDITSVTKNAFQEFANHQNKLIAYRIKPFIEAVQYFKLADVQKRYIGGFIEESFLKEYNVDTNKIYEKNGVFYYDVIEKNPTTEKVIKSSIPVPYEERLLEDREISTHINIIGEVILQLKCENFLEIVSRGLKPQYDKLISEKVKNKLNAVFVYEAIQFFPNAITLKSWQDAYVSTLNTPALTLIENNLLTVNSELKNKNLNNKKTRQLKEKEKQLNHYSLGKTKNAKKTEEIENKQKTELYLNRAFNSFFSTINLQDYFPDNANLENIYNFQDSVWTKIFNKSDKKQSNYEKYYQQHKEEIDNYTQNSFNHSRDFVNFFINYKQEILSQKNQSCFDFFFEQVYDYPKPTSYKQLDNFLVSLGNPEDYDLVDNYFVSFLSSINLSSLKLVDDMDGSEIIISSALSSSSQKDDSFTKDLTFDLDTLIFNDTYGFNNL